MEPEIVFVPSAFKHGVTREDIIHAYRTRIHDGLLEKLMEYKDLTDEEYDALDEELTRTVPKLGPDGTGWLAQRELRLMGLSNMTVNYLFTKAAADHKTPVQIIDELVRERIASAG